MIATYRSSPWLRLVLAAIASAAPAAAAHVWEKQELTFTAARAFANPYTDVTVWVDLAGPNFHKRVYGFWDGGPFFALGDTWWSTGTNRYKWYDDNQERPIGPTAGFKDYVHFRKAQGFK